MAIDYIKQFKDKKKRLKSKESYKVAKSITKLSGFPEAENILLDTNIIYFMTYASSKVIPTNLKPKSAQTDCYSSHFEELLKRKNKFYYSQFSIPELYHIIARTEAQIDSVNNDFDKKKWLREGGRELVSDQMKMILQEINGLAKVLPIIDNSLITPENFIQSYESVYLDGYDIYLRNEMEVHNLKYIMTDDRDFLSVPEVTVITSDNNIKS